MASFGMLRTATLLALGAFLVACASTTAVSPQQIANIRTIGVISVMADSWYATDLSPRILHFSGEDEGKIDLNDPDIDAFTVQQATAALTGHYVVKPVNYGGRAFLGDYDLTNLLGTYASVARLTEKLANDENVDAYVVFYAVPSLNGGILRGFGFYRDIPYFKTATGVYGFYKMAVVDAHTHKEIGHADGFVNEVVDNSLWPARLMPTDDQKTQFKRVVQAALEKQIGPSLKGLKLLP